MAAPDADTHTSGLNIALCICITDGSCSSLMAVSTRFEFCFSPLIAKQPPFLVLRLWFLLSVAAFRPMVPLPKGINLQRIIRVPFSPWGVGCRSGAARGCQGAQVTTAAPTRLPHTHLAPRLGQAGRGRHDAWRWGACYSGSGLRASSPASQYIAMEADLLPQVHLYLV